MTLEELLVLEHEFVERDYRHLHCFHRVAYHRWIFVFVVRLQNCLCDDRRERFDLSVDLLVLRASLDHVVLVLLGVDVVVLLLVDDEDHVPLVVSEVVLQPP